MTKRADAFHAHLDICRRCERNPFMLCPVGARLLRETVDLDPQEQALVDQLRKERG